MIKCLDQGPKTVTRYSLELGKVRAYDQEMPQSHTADQPTAPCERDTARTITVTLYQNGIKLKQHALSLPFR